MLRTGIIVFALFAACQANNLVCFQCSWPDNSDCQDGIVEYEVEPVECSSAATHCVVTKHKNSQGTVTEIDRDCIGDISKVASGCDTKDDGTSSCTETCNNEEGCNAPTPTSPATTPTTTTTKASGAGEVTVSRLVILAAGALTAMLCLKL